MVGGGGGGDHITKHGTHISRDMGPAGGPYISNDMGPFHYYIHVVQSYLKSISLSSIANLIVVAS